MTDSEEHPVRRRLRREDRHELLLDAAVEVLIDKGTRGLTMDRIATRAGVDKRLVYRHFDNAHVVMVEIYRRFNQILASRVIDAIPPEADIEGKVAAAVSAYFDVAFEHRASLPVLLAPQQQSVEEEAGEAQKGFEFMTELLVYAFGVRRDVAPAVAALVASILSGATRGWGQSLGPRTTLEQLAVAGCLAVIRSIPPES